MTNTQNVEMHVKPESSSKKTIPLTEALKDFPIPEHVRNEPIFKNMPSALKDQKIFMGWKMDYRRSQGSRAEVMLDPDTGAPKLTKVPLNINSWKGNARGFGNGSSTDPEKWVTLDTFMKAWNDPEKRKFLHGIGFAIPEGIVGIDKDGFIDPVTGEWNEESKRQVNYLASYTEESPSGKGTHTLLLGAKPSTDRSRNGKEEIYDNQKGRYFTWTGHLIEGFPKELQPNQEGIDKFYYEVVDKKEGKAAEKEEADKEIIKKCSVKCEKFSVLLNGKWEDVRKQFPEYPSESEADQALLTLLASETLDFRQIVSVFKKSERYRPTKGLDYLNRSINNAIEHVERTQKEKEINPVRELYPFYVTSSSVVHMEARGKTKDIIGAKTEITGFSDNLDIDLNDTESNKFTHYKLRTGGITLYPEHGDLLTRTGIIKLIKLGMLAQEGDVKDITGYFMRDIQRAKVECPQIKVCNKPGWKRNKSIFVSGNYAYSDKGPLDVYLTNPITGQMYKTKGSLEGWRIPELVEWLDYDGARFLFYVAFTCYIASLLGVQNIIVSMIDGTSVGKTLSASIAGSGMGRTDTSEQGESIVRSANITQAAAEYLSVAINGHYIVFDDATPGKDYSGIIYIISNGRKKDRAPNSSLEGGDVYNAVYVITGEQRILKDTVTQGANGRVIELKCGIESNVENAKRAKKIEAAIKENYGHISEPFLKKVFGRKESIRSKYFNLCNRFRDEGKDIGGRLGDQMACICIAGEIMEEIFSEIGIPAKDPCAICDQIIQNNATSDQKREYWLRGLELVYGDIDAWEKEIGPDRKFTQNLKIGKGLGGNYTGEWLNIVETNIKDICDKNHLDKRDLTAKWAEMGITRTDAPVKDKHGKEIKKYNKTVKIDGSSKKTISFNVRKVQEILGYVDESEEGATMTGVPKIDIAIFKKHVKDISEAWHYLNERPPEESEVSDFCNLYYGKFPGDSNYYTVEQIMLEAAGNFTEEG